MEQTKRLLLGTGLAFALSLSAAYAQNGEALYEKECQKCHGADGKGETKMGKKLGAKDYTDPKVQEAITDEAFAVAIKAGFKDKGSGKVLMKPSEHLSGADVKALVGYMRSFKKK